MNTAEIAQRIKNGFAATDAEKAFLIRNNIHALTGFMVGNNPGSVNFLLQKLGYNHLGFEPNVAALQRQLDILIERKEEQDLDYVVRNFVVDDSKLTPSFIKELTKVIVK